MTTLGNAQRTRTPTGMKVAPMSYAKLEQVAAGISPLLPKTSGPSRGPWKVDGWRVLEQTFPKLGYNYHLAANDELNDCAAFTIPENKLVVLRQDVYDGLFADDVFSRSTVVHELAHVALNHAVTLYRGAALGKHQFCEDSEWQAKALTAAILMPVDACQSAANAKELAAICGTSEQSAGYRIKGLQERGLLVPKHVKRGLFD